MLDFECQVQTDQLHHMHLHYVTSYPQHTKEMPRDVARNTVPPHPSTPTPIQVALHFALIHFEPLIFSTNPLGCSSPHTVPPGIGQPKPRGIPARTFLQGTTLNRLSRTPCPQPAAHWGILTQNLRRSVD